MLGLKPKPSSEPYQYVSNELGVPPNKIIAIGDRYNVDIKPLINLGGDGVLVDLPDEVCDFAARFLYDDQKRIAENTAVILWSRLPDQNFSKPKLYWHRNK